MALRIHLLIPKTLPQFPNVQPHFLFRRPPETQFQRSPKTQFLCSSNNKNNHHLGDAELSSDLAKEVEKLNTHLVQKEEAMKKSKEILFNEFCQYLALQQDEVQKKWRKFDEDEKRDMIKGFVNCWGAHFHPLSARSVKEMLEEYLHDEMQSSSSGFGLFPRLKKIMGFSEDN